MHLGENVSVSNAIYGRARTKTVFSHYSNRPSGSFSGKHILKKQIWPDHKLMNFVFFLQEQYSFYEWFDIGSIGSLIHRHKSKF